MSLVEAIASRILARVPAGYGMTNLEAVTYAHACLAAIKREGFVCVPKEPTEAMLEASNREWDGRMSARSAGVWQAMLAAIPKQE